MVLQEELARGLLSVANQTLFATMAMTRSVIGWVSSPPPIISDGMAAMSGTLSEGLATMSTTVFGTPSPVTTTESRIFESYANVINTAILLLMVWGYFKTASFVWRSLSTIWQIIVGIWKVLSFVGSGLARLTKRCKQLILKEQIVQVEVSNSTTNDSSKPIRPMLRTNGQRLPRAFPSPPIIPPPGVIWFYYNPGTKNLVPWLVPSQVIPTMNLPTTNDILGQARRLVGNCDAAPPEGASPWMVGGTQESCFRPISETEDNDGKKTATTSIANKNLPVFETTADANIFDASTGSHRRWLDCVHDGSEKSINDGLDNTLAEQNLQEFNSIAVSTGEPAEFIGNPSEIMVSNGNENVGETDAIPTNTSKDADDRSMRGKKRKFTSPRISEDDSSLGESGTTTEEMENVQPSKKQKLAAARARAKAWAEKQFAN